MTLNDGGTGRMPRKNYRRKLKKIYWDKLSRLSKNSSLVIGILGGISIILLAIQGLFTVNKTDALLISVGIFVVLFSLFSYLGSFILQ